MAEEELDLELDNEEITRKDNRINTLTGKLKSTSEERDALKAEAEKAKTEREAAQKDAEFFKSFNTVSAKYQGSSEYQDKIREKAALGLDVEEATMLVMAKEGKYTPPAPVVERQSAAGGSASTSINNPAEKAPKEMSSSELRAQLQAIESTGERLI